MTTTAPTDRQISYAHDLQADEADQAMDAYRARRSELANIDLSTLDCEELSAWIDAAKQHRV